MTITPADARRIADLIDTYADLPLGGTDASLHSYGVKWDTQRFYLSVHQELHNDRFGGSSNVGLASMSNIGTAGAHSRDTGTRVSGEWRFTENQRFVVVLKVTEPEPQFGRIIVADYLPAGFEIDNPRLVSSGDTGTLSWIADAKAPTYSEFRDERFSAAFERRPKDAPVFTVAYVVRAVSPGRYVLPQAYVEDMYRPDRFGRTGTGVIEVLPK